MTATIAGDGMATSTSYVQVRQIIRFLVSGEEVRAIHPFDIWRKFTEIIISVSQTLSHSSGCVHHSYMTLSYSPAFWHKSIVVSISVPMQ